MPNFDRHSVFSLATTEAAPACLARGHSRWLRFCFDRRYSSTFLPPLAPSPLRDFIATMEALTPVRPALRPPTGCMNNRLFQRTGLPDSRIWPSDHSAANHPWAPAIAFSPYPSACRASHLRESGLRQSLAGSPAFRPNRVRYPTD